ncbi:MAG: hypothetical protein PF439_11100 [Helicobacteraceae bacterium]|jgi:hypothetical protein|nr:hypothetical protein [Helicobacteraceae bacterium]
MKHFYLIGLSLSMLLFMGCTKQETKQNLHNVNEGLKNSWHKTKEAVSESTEEFKEETK